MKVSEYQIVVSSDNLLQEEADDTNWKLLGGTGGGANTKSAFDVTMEKHLPKWSHSCVPLTLFLIFAGLTGFQMWIYYNYHSQECERPLCTWLAVNSFCWILMIITFWIKKASDFLAQTCHGCYVLISLILNVVGSAWVYGMEAGSDDVCPDTVIQATWWVVTFNWAWFACLWGATFMFILDGVQSSDPLKELGDEDSDFLLPHGDAKKNDDLDKI